MSDRVMLWKVRLYYNFTMYIANKKGAWTVR